MDKPREVGALVTHLDGGGGCRDVYGSHLFGILGGSVFVLGLFSRKEVKACLNGFITLAERYAVGSKHLDKTALDKSLGGLIRQAEVLCLSFNIGNGVDLHYTGYKLKRVVNSALALYLHKERNLGEAGLLRNVLNEVLSAFVFRRIKRKIEIKHLALYVDAREVKPSALERLVLPARLCLDSFVGEKGILDSIVPVGERSFRLDKPREVGALVTHLDGGLRGGEPCGFFLGAESFLFLFAAALFLFAKSLCLCFLGKSLFSCEAALLLFAEQHFAVNLLVSLKGNDYRRANTLLVLGELLSVIHKP